MLFGTKATGHGPGCAPESGIDAEFPGDCQNRNALFYVLQIRKLIASLGSHRDALSRKKGRSGDGRPSQTLSNRRKDIPLSFAFYTPIVEGLSRYMLTLLMYASMCRQAKTCQAKSAGLFTWYTKTVSVEHGSPMCILPVYRQY